MYFDLTQPAHHVMVALVNHTNQKQFADEDLVFSDVASLDDPEHPTANATVTITGTGTTAFTGPESKPYRRLNLDVLLNGLDPSYVLPPSETAYSVQDILDRINTRANLNLTTDMFEPVEIVEGEDQPLLLQVRDDALLYFGEALVSVTIQPVTQSD